MAANTILLTNHENKPFESDPYVVLSDGSTFDAVNHDVIVAWLTDEGKVQLEDSLDFQNVEYKNTLYVPLSDLIAAYNELKGYNLKSGDIPGGVYDGVPMGG
jgi:hypothetical protein|tara:strand:- start:39 stop:344 length:306 start_codon:yes stop_codon:yes gene_type:complete